MLAPPASVHAQLLLRSTILQARSFVLHTTVSYDISSDIVYVTCSHLAEIRRQNFLLHVHWALWQLGYQTASLVAM